MVTFSSRVPSGWTTERLDLAHTIVDQLSSPTGGLRPLTHQIAGLAAITLADSPRQRPKLVKDHFPDCVSKCGNPQGLRYTDHPSMAKTEGSLQHRGQASHEASDSDMVNEKESEIKPEIQRP